VIGKIAMPQIGAKRKYISY